MVELSFSCLSEGDRRLPDLLQVFEGIEDPRLRRRRVHSLNKILVIALFSIAGGISSWRQMEEFGRLHQRWFGKYLDMASGVPSHDTFRRVFGLLLPSLTQTILQAWFEKRG